MIPPPFTNFTAEIVWDLISGLIRQGHTADLGFVERTYAVYGGQASVSIINGLKQDKKMAP